MACGKDSGSGFRYNRILAGRAVYLLVKDYAVAVAGGRGAEKYSSKPELVSKAASFACFLAGMVCHGTGSGTRQRDFHGRIFGSRDYADDDLYLQNGKVIFFKKQKHPVTENSGQLEVKPYILVLGTFF